MFQRAIAYLLPSGLYQPSCRPVMKPPEEIFPKVKEAKFDESGRPFHFLFYTGAIAVYDVQHVRKYILRNVSLAYCSF